MNHFYCTAHHDQNIREHFDMSNKLTPMTLSTLPVEILCRIFDELDVPTILLSVRNVSQQLRTPVNIYYRYELDLTSIVKPEFHRLLLCANPACITALRLSNDQTTPGQIGAFLSLVDISHFTRLRSLTLLDINEQDLFLFLEHASRCSLTALTIRTNSEEYQEIEGVEGHLLSIIAQPSLRCLELFSSDLCRRISKFKWPVQCKLQYLAMTYCSERRMSKILHLTSDLQTLVVGNEIESMSKNWNNAGRIPLTPQSSLTFLVLSNCSLSMDDLFSLLSSTPSLRHLKIINKGRAFLNGYRWEELIKTKLPALNKFEFHISFDLLHVANPLESDPNYYMKSFRTPFWTGEKRWAVICNFVPTTRVGQIYTSPICTSTYTYFPAETTTNLSNFGIDVWHPTVYEAVNQLSLRLDTDVGHAERVS